MTNHASCRWFKPPENDVLQVNEEAWPWVLSVDVFRLPDETYDKWKALHPANSWPAEGYAMLINEADRIYLYDGAHIFLSCVDARVCAWVKRVRRSIDSQFLILPQALLEATVRKVGMGQGSRRGPLSINTCAGQS